MLKFKAILCCSMAAICFTTSSAQGILKKMKDKAAAVTDKVIEKKANDAVFGEGAGGNNPTGNPSSSSGGRNKSVNKGGQGLITTPPNVNENLGSAEAAFKSGNYNEARYAVQQAMLGVEMEIGQNILKSLPETIAGLKKDAAADQVTSTGWGWVGLTIHREYAQGDKQLTVTIANNSVWMQALNLYFTNTGYAQTTGGEQKWKQTKLKGYKAIIEYDENSGYKLSVPVGQSSLVVFEGVNFNTEQDMMNACGQIDIDNIKKHLGEK